MLDDAGRERYKITTRFIEGVVVPRVFLLSPSSLAGSRAAMLRRERAAFDLAHRFQKGEATLGEVYAFISGLYFRGKLAYGQRFGQSWVIVPGKGLVNPSEVFTEKDMSEI